MGCEFVFIGEKIPMHGMVLLVVVITLVFGISGEAEAQCKEWVVCYW